MILHVVGNRPQFIKMAPVLSAISRHDLDQKIVHTGQHYDANMSEVFFRDLGLEPPSVQLHVGSGTHAEQTGRAMIELERVIQELCPDVVLVYGDTNTTLATGLAAAKLKIPFGHVEGGPRTYDRGEPEEINRLVADHLAKWNFCPDEISVANLAREGIVEGVLHVGDVMYDAFLMFRDRAERTSTLVQRYGLPRNGFALVTFHRPYNTDEAAAAADIVEIVCRLRIMVALPLHPRTEAALRRHGLYERLASCSHVRLMPAVGYLDMLALLTSCRVVLTDSGGIQKEAFYAGKGVVVLHEHTPWMQLEEAGWLRLGFGTGRQVDAARVAETAEHFVPAGPRPTSFGNGDASEMIADVIASSMHIEPAAQDNLEVEAVEV